MTTDKTTTVGPVRKLSMVLSEESVKQLFVNAMQDHSDRFIASIIDLANATPALQQCEPKDVVMECLKAATLGLDINPSLGFAYVIPYGKKPQFQIGYRGLIQLAQNTGQYRSINADAVYEGETIKKNRLAGTIEITGEQTGDNPIGFFGYIELVNGFSKTVYMTVEEITKHAQRFSKAYKAGPWQTDFFAMACKTVIKKALRYGPMSTELQMAYDEEAKAVEYEVEEEIKQNANQKVLDVSTTAGDIQTDADGVIISNEEGNQPGLGDWS